MQAHEYLNEIRASSAYPAFRGVAGAVKWVFYVVGALLVLGGMMAAGSAAGTAAGLVGAGFGALVALLGKVLHESMLMLADLADATIESSARGKQ